MYKTPSLVYSVEELLIRLQYYQKRAITFTTDEWRAEFASHGFDMSWQQDSVTELSCHSSTQPSFHVKFTAVSEKVRRQPYVWSSDDNRFLRVPQNRNLFRVLSISGI